MYLIFPVKIATVNLEGTGAKRSAHKSMLGQAGTRGLLAHCYVPDLAFTVADMFRASLRYLNR
jgi:hypothetical protein